MKQPARCAAIYKLIPWYVNGTLDQDDMVQVDRHLQICEHCRRDIETEMQFSRNYARFAHPDVAQDERTESSLNDLLTALPAATADTGHRLRNAGFVTATIAAIAIGVFALLDNRDTPIEYRTLTLPAQEPQGAVLQLVFQPGTREAEIREIVSGSAASITSGPTPQGVYRIKLAEDIAPRDIDALVKQLRANPVVLMVEAELR